MGYTSLRLHSSIIRMGLAVSARHGDLNAGPRRKSRGCLFGSMPSAGRLTLGGPRRALCRVADRSAPRPTPAGECSAAVPRKVGRPRPRRASRGRAPSSARPPCLLPSPPHSLRPAIASTGFTAGFLPLAAPGGRRSTNDSSSIMPPPAAKLCNATNRPAAPGGAAAAAEEKGGGGREGTGTISADRDR